MTNNKETFIINRKEDSSIIGDIQFSELTSSPLVIFCHGYKGYKDWGAWNLVSDEFVKNDISFCKFNFSLNGGTLDNPIDFPDLDAFGRNTYSTEIKDVHSVVEYVKDKYKDYFNSKKIILIGHSRAGGIVLLSANTKINKVISWAGVSDFSSRFPGKDKLIQWKKDNVIYILNARTKQQMPHYYSFYEDFIENKDNLDIKKAVNNLKQPLLIVQGKKDEAVLEKEAHELHSWSNNSELCILDANHTFGSSHPWKAAELPSKLLEVVHFTINFINKEH